MRLGDTVSPDDLVNGKPLDGIKILALEQMQALPWATQLLTRLGAEVVKVESIGSGDQGRGSLPAMTDPEGRKVGATFLRTNLNKRSICVDLKSDRGRQLVLDLVPQFDVVAENFRAGALDRIGLGYADVAAVDPSVVYLSISGFGHSDTPYGDLPAFAPIVEAMSGIYEMKRTGDDPPMVAPSGALGDIGTALFGVIGVLAALRHKDQTGRGTHVDVAMLDAMVAMTDIVTNFWSMGLRGGDLGPLLMHGFQAADGWFIIQVGREHQFAKLVEAIGHPEWADDERFATRQGWLDHLDDVLRPAIEAWAADKTSMEAARALGAVGVASGPCLTDEQVVVDPHLAARNMLVEVPRTDGVEQPILVPGNPVKMSGVAEGPESRVPWLGEHTDAVLAETLGLSPDDLAALRADGIIA